MPFVETSPGVSIYYEDAGQGSPLVLLHGWGGSGVLWRFQRELADTCRLVIPDLRGHGRSSTPREGITLEELAGDLVIMCERLNLTEAVLVGWSLGSQVAIKAFPELRARLAGVVLLGATARFTAAESYPHGLSASDLRGMGLRLKRDYERTMGDFFRSMFAHGELTPDEEGRIAREVIMVGRLPEPAVAQAGLAILETTDLREELDGIDLPVLLIHGAADAICPLGAGRYLEERFPCARLVEFAGVGHAPCLSRPDQCNALIREFLRKDVHDRH